MADKKQTKRPELSPVAGYFNGLFTRDADGAMAAVVVNPQASHSQRLAWAVGQLELLKTVAQASTRNDDDGCSSLAAATQQLLEQSLAVLTGVLDELEAPPEGKQTGPLRVVSPAVEQQE